MTVRLEQVSDAHGADLWHERLRAVDKPSNGIRFAESRQLVKHRAATFAREYRRVVP